MVEDHFSFTKWSHYSAIWLLHAALTPHIPALWLFFSSPRSWRRSYLSNPRNSSDHFPTDRTVSYLLEHGGVVNSTVSTVPCSLVCTSGSRFRQQSQKEAGMPSSCARKALDYARKWSHGVLVVWKKQSGLHRVDSFFIPKFSCRIRPRRASEMRTALPF